MGLEPMTLRLKVWCSTDWANRAGLNLSCLVSIRLNFPRNDLTQSKYVFKIGPMNGISLLPSRCPTVQRYVSCEISQFCQISELRFDSFIMPWANNEDWARKKDVDVPPDMGLEPMTLRLKVWCSTDWANQATHMCYFFVTSAQKPDSRLVIFQLPQLSTRTFLRTQLQSISCCGRTLTTDHKVRSTGKFLAV